MRSLDSCAIAQLIEEEIPRLACCLAPDIEQAFQRAFEAEERLHAQEVMRQLVHNNHIAKTEMRPLCQDTGSVWVALEVGPDISIAGSILEGVNAAVARAYDKAHLRKSIVVDALIDRSNTQTNTPAFCEIIPSTKLGARLHLMLKGGGSDNASRVCMLTPSAGYEGIEEALLACVKEKAANACPPLIIGLGIGSTFDKVASLAKHALMRPVGSTHADSQIAQIEERLLKRVNALGIGPGALGGLNTALAVHIKSAPCHIAALPLAINMGCCALRRATYEL